MSAGRRFPFFSLFKSFNRHILEPPASQNDCRFLKTSTEKWQMIYCLQFCYNNEKVYFSLIYRSVEMATLFWRWNENRTVCFVLSKLAKIAVFPDYIEFIAQQSAADILHCQLIQFAFIWNQYLNNLQESTQNFRLKSSFFLSTFLQFSSLRNAETMLLKRFGIIEKLWNRQMQPIRETASGSF